MTNILNGTKKNGHDSLALVMPALEVLEKFTAKLNERPDPREIQVNKAAKNSKYLPISFVRMKLDEIFAGLWNFEMTREQVIANEIIGVGVLEVLHPVAKIWIRRSGTAAVMIQLRSAENGGSGRISNIDDKITNTLVKDFPHLESEVLKNAAKKLGKVFGCDLNRLFEDTYSPIYSEEINSEQGLASALDALSKATTKEAFAALWNDNNALQTNPEFQKNYQYYLRKNVRA